MSQMNHIDCGVYVCAYIHNKLHGLSNTFLQKNSLQEQQNICESTYLNRDVKTIVPKGHQAWKLPEMKRRVDPGYGMHMDPIQYCRSCDLHFRNNDAFKQHKQNVHSNSRYFRVCGARDRPMLMPAHEEKCKKKQVNKPNLQGDDSETIYSAQHKTA